MVRILIMAMLLGVIAFGQRKNYGDFSIVNGKLGVNTLTPQFNFVSVCNRTTFGVNGLNVVNSDLNLNRSTVAQASDTSSVNAGFTSSTGKPFFNVVGNDGIKAFEVDTNQRINLPTGATKGILFSNSGYVYESTDVYINSLNFLRIRVGGNDRYFFGTSDFRPSTNGVRDLGTNILFWRIGYINRIVGDGTSARVWGLLDVANNETGGNLTLGAASTVAGGTANLNGGMLTLSPGNSKGQGFASVRLTSNTRSATSSTVVNTLVDRIIIPSEFNLTDAGNNDLFEVALNAGQQTGGHIQFTITCSDGTDHQSVSGMVTYDVVDKAGTLTVQINEIYANTLAASAGTLTRTWSIVDGANKITIRLVPNSSLIPTSMKITTVIFNGGQTVVTQL